VLHLARGLGIGPLRPVNQRMARTLFIKAAWVLLGLALLLGEGQALVWAGEAPGRQIVVVLDLAKLPGSGPAPGSWPQAATLLVHLLKDKDYLGLVASGEQEGLILPTDRLTPAHRQQALGKLARFAPGSAAEPLADLVTQALWAFQPGESGPRALLVLTDRVRNNGAQPQAATLEKMRQVAAQAQKAGVTISFLSQAAQVPQEDLKTLAVATGGFFWEGKTVADCSNAMVSFYQRLAQPQEVPLQGTGFRLDPWVKQAVVVAIRSTPGTGVMLTSPAGARITPKTSVRNLHWVADQLYDLITVVQPRPGAWTLSGIQPGASRVFLDTDLALTAAKTPGEVGEDEVLQVTAALVGSPGNLTGGEMASGAEVVAYLQLPGAKTRPVFLKNTPPGPNTPLPAGVWMGELSPVHQEGEATLKVWALGKTFQRLITRPIAITPPWYRVAVSPEGTQKPAPLRFQPDPERRPEQLAGVVTVQSPQGAMAGVLIAPAPGAEITVAPPPGCQEVCAADLQLQGLAAGGRPLAIASGPFPKIAPKVPEQPAEVKPEAAPVPQGEVKAPPVRKTKRRLIFLVLTGVGAVILMAAGFLMWRERPPRADAEEDEDSGGAGGKSTLRLQAQVEALTKEKVQLQATLEDKSQQIEKLLAEKADLQSSLDRVSAMSKGNAQSIDDLEKKLEEAEKEAQGIQQEYMALYARSQQEKEAIKKN
jgi:hypothetical protein